MKWHSLPKEKVIKQLNTDSDNGLSDSEVRERISKYGKNRIDKEKHSSKLQIFFRQFKSPLIYILIIVAVIVFFLEDYPRSLLESGFILASVLINSMFGFWEENKASRTFEKLKEILKTETIVIRNGNKRVVLQEEIVPGDIIVLSSGDKVPADGRLIEVQDLKISEAVLTGEWLPTGKIVDPLHENTALAERDNMVYAGCLVKGGEGKFVVTATGTNMETGKIADMVDKTKEEKTPLQKKISSFSQITGIAILVITILIFIGGLIRGNDLVEMFETASAIAVGGIPEALPIIMTLTLAIGMERLSKKQGLIRRLSSVETLGSTTVICCDKTKTLTLGEMEPHKVVTLENNFTVDKEVNSQVYLSVVRTATLCNEAFVENPEKTPEKWKIRGTPTDKALFLSGLRSGIIKSELEEEFSLVKRVSFDSSLRYQAGLYEKNGKTFLYVAGAPKEIIKNSGFVKLEKETKKINSKVSKKLDSKVDNLTEKGERVIAFGYRQIKKSEMGKDPKELVDELTFTGFLSIKDPLRKDVKKALKTAKQAGLRLIIITGDHKKTAKSVAEELGMLIKEENILEGSQLDEMSDQEFVGIVEKIKIYARAEPRHKMRIVDAWQDKGEVVAMTGDGVNDAPALKKADIGIAVGSGTEVAKQTSDLVLLNDSFDIIVKAVEEGRTILNNLRKAISYVMADSFTTVVLVGSSLIAGLPLPILWTQILWNNVVEDTLPNIAFAFESKEKDTMKRKPTSRKNSILTKEMKVLIFATGLIDQILALALFWILWGKLGLNLKYARTMTFGAICIDTAFVIYSYKNLKRNIWEIDLFDNRLLLLSSLLVLLFFAGAVYLSIFQNLLQTVPLGLRDWLILIVMAIVSTLLIEVTKWFFITKNRKEYRRIEDKEDLFA